MEKNKKRVPEWKKEVRVGVIVTLSAALFFGGVIAIASADRSGSTGDYTSISLGGTTSDNTDVAVIKDPLEEKLERPYAAAGVSIGRYFYDMEDDLETRAQAIVEIPGKANSFMKSLGVDYVSDEQFNVFAASSGVVTEKINDAVYGNMLMITHQTGVISIYHSLGAVSVNKGESITQGQLVSVSGTSAYNADFANSVHFEVLRQDENLNPEKLFSKLIRDF